jgi:hypothetical protein
MAAGGGCTLGKPKALLGLLGVYKGCGFASKLSVLRLACREMHTVLCCPHVYYTCVRPSTCCCHVHRPVVACASFAACFLVKCGTWSIGMKHTRTATVASSAQPQYSNRICNAGHQIASTAGVLAARQTLHFATNRIIVHSCWLCASYSGLQHSKPATKVCSLLHLTSHCSLRNPQQT